MHDLRRATLFARGRHGDEIVYDENHADDRDPDNHCLLLMWDGKPVGITRLDKRGANGGVVRLVAISPELQRQGHGRLLSALVEDEARARGMRWLFVNAHKSAVGYYENTGWRLESWDPGELVGLAAQCVQMSKTL